MQYLILETWMEGAKRKQKSKLEIMERQNAVADSY